MLDRTRPFRSILLCADRSGEAEVALRKASILARYLDADIELFACDSDHAWAVEHSPDDESARAELAACLTESRRYLGALRSSIAASDLRLTTRAACATSFAAGVAERVAEGGHDLVIKNFADGVEPQRTASAAADLALAEVCRVPLMLTRRRPWRPEPCIWAALDLQRVGIPMGRRVIEVARDLAAACDGRFGIAYCRPTAADSPRPLRSVARARAVFKVETVPLQVLEGDPAAELASALRSAGVDVLVTGQAERPGSPSGSASITERLMGLCGCDALIVPAPSRRSAAGSGLALATLGADAPDGER